QSFNACTMEPASLHEPSQSFRWQWIAMRGIHIKRARTYGKVLGIRSFQHQQASGTQHASSLVQQCDNPLKWQVLDQMNRSDHARVIIGHCLQVLYRITFNHFEATAAAHINEDPVDLDALSNQPVVTKGLQPFPTPTADIDHRSGGSAKAGLSYESEIG